MPKAIELSMALIVALFSSIPALAQPRLVPLNATSFERSFGLAEAGDANAQSLLGYLYQEGRVVPQNYQEAVKWYRLSAEQGHAEAQERLGWHYEAGRGVPQNYRESAKWYRLAAGNGFTPAQSGLAYLYEWGLGVSRDYQKAYLWYSVATALYPGHSENRDRVALQLSQQALQQAQAQATKCFESNFKDCD